MHYNGLHVPPPARLNGRAAVPIPPFGDGGQPVRDAPPEPLPEPPQRGAGGRFVRGNKGGPGNPFARRVGAVRRALLDFLTDARLDGLCRALFRRAVGGDVAAARLLLSYTAGRPAEAPDPDREDLGEWRLLAEDPGTAELLEAMQARVPAAVAVQVVPPCRAEAMQAGLDRGDAARAAAPKPPRR